MNSVDVPEARSLDTVRRLVAAIAAGRGIRNGLADAADLSERHVGYHVHAARILGWINVVDDHFTLTPSGRALLATPTASNQERECIVQAIRNSAVVDSVAPKLLDAVVPDAKEIEDRIRQRAKLKPATAHKRAAVLIAWRERALHGAQLSLLEEAFAGVRDSAVRPKLPPAPSRPSDRVRIRAVQIANFGPIKRAEAYLDPLSIAIGENASGKSSFFDAIAFIADAMALGVINAVLKRAKQLEELLWYGQGDGFQIAVELTLPHPRDAAEIARAEASRVARYELEVGRLEDGSVGVKREMLFLRPAPGGLPTEVRHSHKPKPWRRILSRPSSGHAQFEAERSKWTHPIFLGTSKLALDQLPGDNAKFPIGQQIAAFFRDGITLLSLNTATMRWPASPVQSQRLLPDGGNWALVVADLAATSPRQFNNWLRHVRQVLPDVAAIRVVEREEDRHLYVKVRYKDELELPSWRLSDGTLRILALTLLAFATKNGGIYLIEEPENGVHPQAIEALFDTFRTPFDVQILLASHSPILLSGAPTQALLCFDKRNGDTRIIPGRDHPLLKEWRHKVPVEVLFASGLLGR